MRFYYENCIGNSGYFSEFEHDKGLLESELVK